jgi:hypothetical protein
MARTRSYTLANVGSKVAEMVNPTHLTSASSPWTIESTCIDSLGKGFPHDLEIDYKNHFFWSLNGTSRASGAGGFLSWKYNGYSMGGTAAHIAPTSTEPTDNTSLSMMLARTNPSRPLVALPVFLYELKDIPELLKQWNRDAIYLNGYFSSPSVQKLIRDAPRRFAQTIPEWEFGVKPFFNDMLKVLQVQKSMDRKIRMLKNLQKGGSAGGYAVVWENTAVGGPFTGYVSPLYQEENTYAAFVETTYRKWGTCTWIPAIPLPPMTDTELWWKAMQLTTGMDFSLSNVYSAMPWSWLIDWFTNVGDIVDSYRNTIPVKHDGSCIMLHVVTRYKTWVQTGGSGQIGASVNKSPLRESKLRRVMGSVAPVAEYNLSFLNDKQLSILGSLAVIKRSTVSL